MKKTECGLCRCINYNEGCSKCVLDEEKWDKTKLLECGHEGCNYHEGCRMCVLNKENKEEEKAMLADKKLVEDLLKNPIAKVSKRLSPYG